MSTPVMRIPRVLGTGSRRGTEPDPPARRCPLGAGPVFDERLPIRAAENKASNRREARMGLLRYLRGDDILSSTKLFRLALGPVGRSDRRRFLV
jgi:hypothetical protein